ncbi:MAG: hydantoinase/oxoprolinase N-terminal domain-containing protein, partial [Candidatus Rokuibacteriota bacterium]
MTPPGTTRAKDYVIALDVGGTFTDVALVHEASGRLWVTKTPTTPHDPSAGFI